MPFPVVPCTVRPLKPVGEHLPIIAATEREGITRESGEVINWLDLPEVIRTERGIIATNCAATLLQFLEERCGKDPLWQVRVTIREKSIARFDDRIRVSKPIIGFLGFMAAKDTGKRRVSHYWQVLDPTVFLDDPKASMKAAELMRWAIDVRDWCKDNGIRVKATAGGLSGQLLRHPTFYSESRRRIPGATNDRARKALPGNHYELRADTSIRYSADYIDQSSAHHSAILATDLPDDKVYALGHFKPDDENMQERPWCKLSDLPRNSYGLLWAKIWTPEPKQRVSKWDGSLISEYRPEWANREGERYAYVFTNEIPLLWAFGGHVQHVTAAWLSRHKDTGLPAYAQWALDETAKAEPARKEWLKKALLTTYGLLATKPTCFEVGWRQSKGGTTRNYPIGGEMMPFQVRRTSKPLHPKIAHVIQRGMIEAETRKRSLELANGLLARGEHVLCIYGDGILVKTSPDNCPPWRSEYQPELLPAPWRIKETVTSLQFINEQSFRSRQITRLPGMPRSARREKSLV